VLIVGIRNGYGQAISRSAEREDLRIPSCEHQIITVLERAQKVFLEVGFVDRDRSQSMPTGGVARVRREAHGGAPDTDIVSSRSE
jgi:hypothetical protein